MNQHIGSSLDDLLREDGLQEEAVAAAVKRVVAWQLVEAARDVNEHQGTDGRFSLEQQIDAYASAHHMTRSGFLAKAAQQAMHA